MSDLVTDLRKIEAYMKESRERMAAAIRREFPNGEHAEGEMHARRSIEREAADEIERLQAKVDEQEAYFGKCVSNETFLAQDAKRIRQIEKLESELADARSNAAMIIVTSEMVEAACAAFNRHYGTSLFGIAMQEALTSAIRVRAESRGEFSIHSLFIRPIPEQEYEDMVCQAMKETQT